VPPANYNELIADVFVHMKTRTLEEFSRMQTEELEEVEKSRSLVTSHNCLPQFGEAFGTRFHTKEGKKGVINVYTVGHELRRGRAIVLGNR
jgi:hypothetical protein